MNIFEKVMFSLGFENNSILMKGTKSLFSPSTFIEDTKSLFKLLRIENGQAIINQFFEKAVRADLTLKAILSDLFGETVIRLTFTDLKNWHMGLMFKNLENLTPNEGREFILNKVKNVISEFIFDKEVQEKVNIHIQQLPTFVRAGDIGTHISIGMNDEYLEKPTNYDVLREEYIPDKSEFNEVHPNGEKFCIKFFEIGNLELKNCFKGFGFLNGNETKMDECNGRTGFVGILSQGVTNKVLDLKKKFLTKNNLRVPHITLAYLSFELNSDAHKEWNELMCPTSKNESLEKYWIIPKFKTHVALPFLIPNLFNKITDEVSALFFRNYCDIYFCNCFNVTAELDRLVLQVFRLVSNGENPY